jgi:hypothetical protein
MASWADVWAWVEANVCVRAWALHYVENRKSHAGLLFRFFEELRRHEEFVNLSPEMVLEWQDRAEGRHKRFLILDILNRWVDAMPLRYGSKVGYRSTIRQFFLFNHVELPSDVGFVFHSEKPKVRRELGVEDLRKILLSSSPMYRAVLLMMFQSGMGEGEIVYVNEQYSEHVLRNLNSRVLRFDLVGRKRLRNRFPYYSFIGTDALRAIRDYVQSSQRRVLKPLFVNEYGRPITEQNICLYFLNRCKRLGLIHVSGPPCTTCGEATSKLKTVRKGKFMTLYLCKQCGQEFTAEELGLSFQELCSIRYDKSAHECKDAFRTQLQFAGVSDKVAEFLMGHGELVDPNDYNKFMNNEAYVVAEYMKALPYLNILSEEPRKMDKLTVLRELEQRDVELRALHGEMEKLRESQNFLESEKVRAWLMRKMKEDGI